MAVADLHRLCSTWPTVPYKARCLVERIWTPNPSVMANTDSFNVSRNINLICYVEVETLFPSCTQAV